MRNGKNNLLNKLTSIDNRFKTLGLNTIIFGIGNVLSKVILFFLMPLYTSALSPSQYGTAELLNNSVDLIMPFVTLCLYEAVFRFSIDNENYNKVGVFSNCLRVSIQLLVLSIAICLLAFIISSSVYPLYFLIMLIPFSFRQMFAQFTRGIGYSKDFAMSGVLNALSLVFFNLFFLKYLQLGVLGYIISIALGNFLSAFYLFSKIKLYRYINFKEVDKNLGKQMLTYSLPMIPNSISWWFANISTRYILMFFKGLTMAGLFTAISKLPAIINMLSSIFQQAWQFSASKELKTSDRNSFFTNVFTLYYHLIILSCSYLITLIPFISRIILRGEFFSYWIYVPFLLVSAVLNCFSVYFGSIYTAAMNNKMIMISTVTGAIVNVGSSFIFIPIMGIVGAILSTNLSYLIIVLMRYFDTKRFVQLKISIIYFLSLMVIIYLQSFGYIFFEGNFFVISLICSLAMSGLIVVRYSLKKKKVK